VGHGRYILYNAVNRAGASKSREVRGPLLVEVLAARRRDSAVMHYGTAVAASEAVLFAIPSPE
jgi:hypothetical protein